MKNKALICTLALMTFSISLKASETYLIDPNHSFVQWNINHFGFSNPTGKWYANGTIELDKTQLENSKAEVKINVSEMVTGISQLDKHMKGEQFFDVAKFPTATFASDKIDVVNNQITKVQGTLTVHGVSKPVTLNVKMNKMGRNPINDQETIGFTGDVLLKRSDFGITTLIPGLSDEVKLEIEVEANKPKGS